MYTPEFKNILTSTLDGLRAEGLYKEERFIASQQYSQVTLKDGRSVINMCANNYLGLANNPEVMEAAKKAIDQWGFGMASVRFICGTQTLHRQLEERLTQFLGTEDTILFPSCFDANGGLFEGLLTADDAIISDSLNHASIIDGVRLCKAKRFRYANNDMADLEAKLQEADAAGARVKLISTDGVFSMDGIIAQLEEQYDKAIKEGVQKNITNPVGVFLFKQTFYNNSTDENEALLQQIPANFQNDETIVRIKEMTDKQKKTAVGTQFVDFEMQTPEGKTVKLSDYVGKGKVVLVDFWASWCGPCRREMPNLVETYAKYKGKNFEIVGVSLDQDGAAWKEAIKKLDMTWPQMSDLKFWQSEGAQLYAVNSIPHTVLIDGSGKIIARGLHGEELQAKIAEAVK